MGRQLYNAERDARGWIAAELARGTPHHEIIQDLLIEPRFAAVFSHLDDEDDPEAIRREAVAMLNTALDELETWAA